jgi:hypothetical protein
LDRHCGHRSVCSCLFVTALPIMNSVRGIQ